MGRIDVLFLSVGGQIGSAWLFAVLSASSEAGPAAVLSWVVAAVVFTLIAIPWMELGATLPANGAVVRYPFLTHGRLSGIIIGWSAWIFAVSIPALEAVASLTYLSSRFPHWGLTETVSATTVLTWPLGVVLAIGLMAVFGLINVAGVKAFAKATEYLTVIKIVIPALTAILLFAVFNSDNFHVGGFAPYGASPIFNAVSTTGIAFAFVGFRQALDFGGEMRNPVRDIKWVFAGALLIPTVLYILLQVAFIGALNWQHAAVPVGDWAALSASEWAAGPFFHALNAAGLAGFGAFATLLLIDAVLSPAGAGWIYLGNSARVALAMSREGAAPHSLSSLSRRGVPTTAIVASFILGCVMLLPAPGWYRLVSIVSAAGVLTFLVGGASLIVLRAHAPELPRPLAIKTPKFWAATGFVASGFVIYWSGFATLNTLVFVAALALPLYSLTTATAGRPQRALSVATAAIFATLWAVIYVCSGYFLSDTKTPSMWPFWVYWTALMACIIGWCVATFALNHPTSRSDLRAAAWTAVIPLYLPVSYFGSYGLNNIRPVMTFPADFGIIALLSIISLVLAVRLGALNTTAVHLTRAERDFMTPTTATGDSLQDDRQLSTEG